MQYLYSRKILIMIRFAGISSEEAEIKDGNVHFVKIRMIFIKDSSLS